MVKLDMDARNQNPCFHGCAQRTFGQRMHARYEANPGCAQPTSRMRATPLIGVLVLGGALASAKFAHGVHAHGVQPCSEPQCSVAALPSSTSVCARGQDQAVALSAKRARLGRLYNLIVYLCIHCHVCVKCLLFVWLLWDVYINIFRAVKTEKAS